MSVYDLIDVVQSIKTSHIANIVIPANSTTVFLQLSSRIGNEQWALLL